MNRYTSRGSNSAIFILTLLKGCSSVVLGLMALRQYFSLNQAVSQRERLTET